jgi:hypothetical protein
VEAIAPPDRPDPSFRKHFTTREGVLSFDDLAKSKESRGAAGAVLFTPEAGEKIIVRGLKRPPYVLDVHPVGKGFASRSKANILTVYDEKLEVDFETGLSATPEVEANQKRFDLVGAGAGAVLWGDAHLALNCIALSPERDRYLYSHVDEAWCVDRDGKRLWGIRMPTRPVETYSNTFDAGGIGIQTGSTSDIEQALGNMDLQMPITPQEIRERYRALVRQLHPDINPGCEERMKTVNAAYETLTGATQDGAAKTKRTGKVLNDDRADWREVWALFPGDVAYVWHGALHASTVAESLVAAGFAVRSQIIWAKDRPCYWSCVARKAAMRDMRSLWPSAAVPMITSPSSSRSRSAISRSRLMASSQAARRSASHTAVMASCSIWWRRAGSSGMFTLLEGAVGDLAQQAGVMVQSADMAPVNLVGVSLEVVVAQGFQPLQHRVDLELCGHEGVEGFGIVGRAAGVHGVVSGGELHRSGAIRIAPSRSAIN